MTTRALGIDLGASAVHLAVLEDGERDGGRDRGDGGTRLRVRAARSVDAADLDTVLAIAHGADAVAIDAPAAPSTAVHRDDESLGRKFRVARCGEIALGEQARIWVPWVTPADPDAMPGWIRVGFSVWDALAGAGHEPIEVYPAGVFRVLAGSVPPKKTTAAGRRARIDLLAPSIHLPAGIERWSHDGLDALAAALTASHHAIGRARGCGHGDPACDGSAIWLPASPG
jgi:predicted nuclease with RNAse H fold